MLNSLHIENIAVIERADIEFGGGFNVLTGETGAGKSMVIDAIDAILGGRVSREIVRHGAEKAVVNAVFTDVPVADWCRENDVDEEEELIIQRRITADGKSACRVNGLPVTVQQLRSLGALLLDIHGQNDGRQLLDEARHMAYLDRFGALETEKEAFFAAFSAYRETRDEIRRLSMDEREKERLSETLQYQIAELEKAELCAGEEEELLGRRELMKNSGRLTEDLERAYAALYDGDGSAVERTADAAGMLSHAAQFAPEMEETVKMLQDVRYILEDVTERVNDLRKSLDFSPQEYDRIETRLSQLRRLQKRYNTDEAGLIALLESSRERLDEIEYAGERVQKLERKLAEQVKNAQKLGQKLTESRREAGEKLTKRIENELRELSMPSVRFRVDILPVDNAVGFDASGCDEIRFLMSANAGEEPGRISKIASGGELSRIMLAMKSVFAEKDAVPSLIFDEIDTGVSGIAAQRVGEKIGALSRHKQIICITHLPQIAAMADSHYAISKAERGGRTYTSVEALEREGRLQELARLRDGESVSATALAAAAEQLAAAEAFKARP